MTTATAYPSAVEQRLRTLLDRTQQLRPEDLDLRAVRATPIRPEVADVLRYFIDVEGFTPDYEASLRANPLTGTDALVDEFLGKWKHEESVHAEVMELFLDNVPIEESAEPMNLSDRRLDVRRGANRVAPPTRGAARLDRFTHSACSLPLVGDRMAHVMLAVHMAWGGAQESLTNWGYSALRRGCAHPELSRLVTWIKNDEHKHEMFYFEQARFRLGQSVAAQRLAAFALDHLYSPVGVGRKRPEEFGMVATALMELSGKAIESADALNQKLRNLPGMERVNAMGPAVERTLRAYRASIGGVPA